MDFTDLYICGVLAIRQLSSPIVLFILAIYVGGKIFWHRLGRAFAAQP